MDSNLRSTRARLMDGVAVEQTGERTSERSDDAPQG